MKRFVSIILSTIMIFSSIAAYATNGDVIHIGLQKIFRADSQTQADEILEAIESGANEEEFYRVVENEKERKYINIAQNEKEQLEYLANELLKAGVDLNDPEGISKFVSNNTSIETELKNIENKNTYEFQNIPDAKDQVEANYYGGDLGPSLKEGENYSIPVPGSKDNTTKIERLKLPEGTYSWKIKLLHNKETSIPFNKELKEEDGYKAYKQNENIEVQGEKYLGLYAVNTENKVKAFTSIELKPEMIKQPREVAEDLGETELEAVKAEKLDNIANAIKVTGISEKIEETYEYKVILKDNKIEKVYTDLEIEEKDIVNNLENIKIAQEQLDDDFTKYIYVLKISKDENPKILGYKELEITKKNINSPAPKLETTAYTGPVKGNEDGSTKFTKLELTNTTFKYIIADKVDIPMEGAVYSEIGKEVIANTDIEPTDEQKTLIGKELLLVSIDTEDKVIAYVVFNLTTENVKGQTAPQLTNKIEDNENYNYTLPIKGINEKTTKIDELKLEGIENETKFMYEIIDEQLSEPLMIDEIRENAKDLKEGQDIEVSNNNYLLILATDNDGKIKAYAVIELTSDMIKDPIAEELQFSINYSMPERGTKEGNTIFEHLNYDNAEFHYKLSEKEIEKPESGSELPEDAKDNKINFEEENPNKTKDIVIYDANNEKLKDENGFTLNMTVYAVDKDDKDDKVVAYKNFIINQDNVKLPDATKLPEDNYGELTPGNSENSTMLNKLNKQGLDPNLQYYYKFVPESTTVGINEKVTNIRPLEAGKDLRTAKAGENLLILLVDSEHRTKYYATIQLTTENVRGPNANTLRTPQHYSEPIAGSKNGSTKFEHLGFSVGQDFIEGATKFMVKVSDKPFRKIEIDKAVEGASDYAKIEDGELTYTTNDKKSDENGNILNVDIEKNKHLLLLATDDDGKVKAYKELILNKRNIRGGDATEIPNGNYELGVGEKPSTTTFTKLEKYGFSRNITWLYKWSEDGKFSPEQPYINQIVDTNEFKSIRENQDILVNKVEGDSKGAEYGYILLYAVLNGREVQGYKAIPVKSNVVKEHADKLTGISLGKGEKTDQTKVNITDEGIYKYIITKTEPDVPAKNADIETVTKDAKGIKNKTELLVSIGQYITVYKVDKDNKIQGYISLPVKSENIKQGSATFVGISDKKEIEIPEGNLNNGLYEIKVKLKDAKWSENLYKVENVRNALFDGFEVDKEKENWDRVVAKLKETGRHGLSIKEDTLTITTTRTDDYDINDEQRITLIIPAIALENAINPIEVEGTIVVKPTIGATISGSIMSKNRQSDINSGETTIIVKLKDGSFKSWNAENKQKLIDGFVGNGGDNSIWNKADGIKSKIKPENVIPQSPQEVKITIPANAVEFGIESETITLTIPGEIVTDCTEEDKIVATPRFEIRPDILRVEGSIKEEQKVEVEAPLYKTILPEKNKWTIDVSVGTVKDNLTIKDIEIAGLGGLRATAKKVEGENQIEITLSGTSTTPIPEDGKDLEITIKGSAIEEANSLDSDPIIGTIYRQDSIIDELEGVTIDVANNKLNDFNDKTMEYSLNSRNGTDGEWYSKTNISDNGGFKEGKVYVRSQANKKVFHQVAELKSDPAPRDIKVTKLEYSDDNKTLTLTGIGEGDGYEYSIGNGGKWEKIENNLITIPKNITSIKVRKVATKDKLYSLPATVEWLDLGAVELNLAEGILENTSSKMEYSFNSTNGLDGDWRLASNGKTKIMDVNKLHELEGKTIHIRERKNEEYNRKINDNPIERNAQVDKGEIKVNYKEKTISNSTGEAIDIKIGNGKWTTITKNESLTNIDFISGEDIIYRTSAANDKIYSHEGFKTMVPYPGPTPYVEYNDETNKVKKIGKDENATTISKGYEFKEKASTNWVDVTEGKLADKEFIGDVVVQIRKSATENEVAGSIKEIVFTKDIDLEKVTLDKNATPPQLLSTEPEMEYQIFFKGQEPPRDWKRARKGNTPLSEIKNLDDVLLILIRDGRTKTERKDPVYGDAKNRPVDLDGIKYSISSSEITFTGITDKMQYKKSTDSTWKDGSSDGKVEYQELEPIELTIRDKNYPTKTRTIKVDTRADTPNIQVVKYDYKDDGTIGLTLSEFDKDIMEYSLDGGNSYIVFTNNTSIFNIAKNHKFVVRAKVIETDENEEGKLPSQPTAELNGIYLGDVGLNPMERKIEGTSALMEYSLNSTDGKNGTWTKANSPNTTIPNFTTGMTVWIREIAKPVNARELIEKTKREEKPKYEETQKDISYNIKEKTIINNSGKDLKYRIAGGKWIDLPADQTASSVDFKPGDFHILAKGGAKKLDSDPVLVTTIKAQASAPTVEYNDVTNKVTKINDSDDSDGSDNFSTFEYKLPNSNYWIDGKFLSGEEFVGDVVVQIRIKATKEELPSQIREVKFTGLDLRKVRLSTHVDPYELNGTTKDMEFKLTVNGGGLDKNSWTKCNPDKSGNTKLYYKDSDEKIIEINSTNIDKVDKIEIRRKDNEKEIVEVPKP